jgi:hypothetical protein
MELPWWLKWTNDSEKEHIAGGIEGEKKEV